MSKRYQKKCLHCDTRPSFNEPGQKGGIYCAAHAFHLKNPTNVVSSKCEHQRLKADCTEGNCNGTKRAAARCEPHNRVMANCAPCGGANICVICKLRLGNPKYMNALTGEKRCAKCVKKPK